MYLAQGHWPGSDWVETWALHRLIDPRSLPRKIESATRCSTTETRCQYSRPNLIIKIRVSIHNLTPRLAGSELFAGYQPLNVLRHSIGQYGKPARCDELGWVSIEEFIRNDHAWPEEDQKAWDYQNREFKPEVLKVRREILMEGYWYTLNCHPIKRRLMIAALRVPPQNVDQIQQIEGSTLYDADRLARSGGWIRPLAIRATSGHSFSGEHKGLCAWTSTMTGWTCNWQRNSLTSWQVDTMSPK